MFFFKNPKKIEKIKLNRFSMYHIITDTDNTRWNMGCRMHKPAQLCEKSVHRSDSEWIRRNRMQICGLNATELDKEKIERFLKTQYCTVGLQTGVLCGFLTSWLTRLLKKQSASQFIFFCIFGTSVTFKQIKHPYTADIQVSDHWRSAPLYRRMMREHTTMLRLIYMQSNKIHKVF